MLDTNIPATKIGVKFSAPTKTIHNPYNTTTFGLNVLFLGVFVDLTVGLGELFLRVLVTESGLIVHAEKRRTDRQVTGGVYDGDLWPTQLNGG